MNWKAYKRQEKTSLYILIYNSRCKRYTTKKIIQIKKDAKIINLCIRRKQRKSGAQGPESGSMR